MASCIYLPTGTTPHSPLRDWLITYEHGWVQPSVDAVRYGFQVWDGAAWMMYMSAVDHVLWSARWALTGGGRGPLMFAATLLAVVPLAVTVRLVLRWSETQLLRSLAIGAGAPLLLCLVAIDYGRWITFAGVATVASVMTVVPRDPTVPPWRVIIACAAVPLVGVITGPLILRGFGRMVPMM